MDADTKLGSEQGCSLWLELRNFGVSDFIACRSPDEEASMCSCAVMVLLGPGRADCWRGRPAPPSTASRSDLGTPAPPQPVAALERTDASFTTGAPAERRAGRSRALLPRLAPQHDTPDAAVARRALIGTRGKAAVGDGQARSMVEECDVAIERRRPEGAF